VIRPSAPTATDNVTSIADAFGSVVERYAYDPYGTPAVLDADFTLDGTSDYGWDRLFQDKALDAAIGKYNFNMRVYNPMTGRFEQADPGGYIDGSNRYVADVGSPLRFVDPMGLDSALPRGFPGARPLNHDGSVQDFDMNEWERRDRQRRENEEWSRQNPNGTISALEPRNMGYLYPKPSATVRAKGLCKMVFGTMEAISVAEIPIIDVLAIAHGGSMAGAGAEEFYRGYPVDETAFAAAGRATASFAGASPESARKIGQASDFIAGMAIGTSALNRAMAPKYIAIGRRPDLMASHANPRVLTLNERNWTECIQEQFMDDALMSNLPIKLNSPPVLENFVRYNPYLDAVELTQFGKEINKFSGARVYTDDFSLNGEFLPNPWR
jgi:RHS repeat-associated protein